MQQDESEKAKTSPKPTRELRAEKIKGSLSLVTQDPEKLMRIGYCIFGGGLILFTLSYMTVEAVPNQYVEVSFWCYIVSLIGIVALAGLGITIIGFVKREKRKHRLLAYT